jgi:hypothetical protein
MPVCDAIVVPKPSYIFDLLLRLSTFDFATIRSRIRQRGMYSNIGNYTEHGREAQACMATFKKKGKHARSRVEFNWESIGVQDFSSTSSQKSA